MAAGRQDAPVCHDADQGDRAGIRPGTSRRGRCGDSGTAGNATGDRGSVCGKYGNCGGSEGPSHPEACAVRGLRHNAGHSDFLGGSGHHRDSPG